MHADAFAVLARGVTATFHGGYAATIVGFGYKVGRLRGGQMIGVHEVGVQTIGPEGTERFPQAEL